MFEHLTISKRLARLGFDHQVSSREGSRAILHRATREIVHPALDAFQAADFCRYLEAGHGGFPQPGDRERLLPTFERITLGRDWRGPLDFWLCEVDVPDVNEAVEFFTATSLTIVARDFNGKVRVTAPGYRAGPAGA